jgi:predicted nucleic acid-binding protein
MSAERVLVDTSVWIEYFRNPESEAAATLDGLLDDCEICVPKIVLAELVQGAKSAKELAVIGDFFEAFHVIDQSSQTWMKAGRLAYDLKKKGKTIHLLDCYLAVMAEEHACSIFTLNRHFQEIREITGLPLFQPPSGR